LPISLEGLLLVAEEELGFVRAAWWRLSPDYGALLFFEAAPLDVCLTFRAK